jgi:DNA polymerase-3 subunit delta'
MPRFTDIQGQDTAHDIVRRAVSRDRLPHAYLFEGTQGVGKTTTALALAQFLNCASPTEDDSCGECRSCRMIDRLQHPDVHWIFPMPGSEKGKKLRALERIDHMSEVREKRLAPDLEDQPRRIHGLSYAGVASIAIGGDEDTRPGSIAELRHQATYAPAEGRIKVFIITEAERMKREAANSLLKILEEPPPNNLLVLTTHRPGDLLDTIASRCQAVRFRDLTEEEIVHLLAERGGWHFESPSKGKRREWLRRPPGSKDALLAAALSRGSLTRAGTLAHEKLRAWRDTAIEFLSLEPGDPRLHQMIKDLDKDIAFEQTRDASAAENDRRVIELVLDLGLLWYGDVLRASTGSGVPLVNRDRERDVRSAAAHLPVGEIRRRVTLIENARTGLRGNVYRILVLYPLIMNLNGSGEGVGVS